MSARPKSGRPRKRYHPLKATLSIQGMPELVQLLRRDMAKLLRDVADDESPAVAKRLLEIAAVFETGLDEDV